MTKYKPKPKAWFVKRIGKRIFRDYTHDCCKTCMDVAERGLIIADESHADYLASVDSDFAAEGIFSNYRDKK